MLCVGYDGVVWLRCGRVVLGLRMLQTGVLSGLLRLGWCRPTVMCDLSFGFVVSLVWFRTCLVAVVWVLIGCLLWVLFIYLLVLLFDCDCRYLIVLLWVWLD